MTTTLPLVLSSLEFKLPVFVSTKYHPLPAMTRAKTIREASLFRARPSVALKRIENGDIYVFDRERLEPREMPFQWHHRSHFVSFVIYSSGAKFEDYRSNVSREILDLPVVFYNFNCSLLRPQFSNYIIQKH